MDLSTVIVLGTPRSGTSLLTKLCETSGLNLKIFDDSKFFGNSVHNPTGYHEEVRLTLLNDQLIRGLYSYNNNFLSPPDISNEPVPRLKQLDGFAYDIDETTLDIPKDYLENLEKYTGHPRDDWGLGRMLKQQRWYRGYSKFGLNDGDGVLRTVAKYKERLNKKRGFLIKDPRLTFTLPFYGFESPKIIIVERSEDEILISLRSHYGPRFLTDDPFDGHSWVSNHFNLNIKPMTRVKFFSLYDLAMRKIKIKKKKVLSIDYNKLVERDRGIIKILEDFLERKINTDWIGAHKQ